VLKLKKKVAGERIKLNQMALSNSIRVYNFITQRQIKSVHELKFTIIFL